MLRLLCLLPSPWNLQRNAKSGKDPRRQVGWLGGTHGWLQNKAGASMRYCYSPSFYTQSWERRKPESAGKGRYPGCPDSCRLKPLMGSALPTTEPGLIPVARRLFKNSYCLSFREAQRKPEAGTFCQHICKILKELWLSSMHFTSSSGGS